MSVTTLLCEGIAGGPDVRLLRVILRGIHLEVVPSGGKDGFRNAVIAMRSTNAATCAFCDNDFPRDPFQWAGAQDAQQWETTQKSARVMIGWKWRRKEIENYFIDPDLLARVLGWNDARKVDYVTKLESVFDSLAHVMAARMALTACAARRNRLATQVPFLCDTAAMKAELSSRAREFNAQALVDEQRLLDTFDTLLPECQRGGRFRTAALDVFAGKDIMARIPQTSGMPREMRSRDRLLETVLDALEKDPTSHAWSSEWGAIRAAVQIWTPVT